MATQIRDLVAAQITDAVITSGTPITLAAPTTIFPLARNVRVRVFNDPASPPYTVAAGPDIHPQSNMFYREVGLYSNFADGLVLQANASNQRPTLRLEALALSAIDPAIVALGTVSTQSGYTTVVGEGTNFTAFAPGDLLKLGDFYGTISNITDDFRLELASAAPVSQIDRTWGQLNALTGSNHVIVDGTRTVTGTGSLYTAELSLGDIIRLNDQIFTVESITNDTTLITKEPAIGGETTFGNAGLGYIMSDLGAAGFSAVDTVLPGLNCMATVDQFIPLLDIGPDADATECIALRMRTLYDFTFLTDSVDSGFDGSTVYLDGACKVEFTEDA